MLSRNSILGSLPNAPPSLDQLTFLDVSAGHFAAALAHSRELSVSCGLFECGQTLAALVVYVIMAPTVVLASKLL